MTNKRLKILRIPLKSECTDKCSVMDKRGSPMDTRRCERYILTGRWIEWGKTHWEKL